MEAPAKLTAQAALGKPANVSGARAGRGDDEAGEDSRQIGHIGVPKKETKVRHCPKHVSDKKKVPPCSWEENFPPVALCEQGADNGLGVVPRIPANLFEDEELEARDALLVLEELQDVLPGVERETLTQHWVHYGDGVGVGLLS